MFGELTVESMMLPYGNAEHIRVNGTFLTTSYGGHEPYCCWIGKQQQQMVPPNINNYSSEYSNHGAHQMAHNNPHKTTIPYTHTKYWKWFSDQ